MNIHQIYIYGPHDELMSMPCAQKQNICQQVLEQDTEAAMLGETSSPDHLLGMVAPVK